MEHLAKPTGTAGAGRVGRARVIRSHDPPAVEVCRIVSPSALAALRLMTSSNFVGCSTGKSEDLLPWCRISSLCDEPRAYDSDSTLVRVRRPEWRISLDACASSQAIGSGVESSSRLSESRFARKNLSNSSWTGVAV